MKTYEIKKTDEPVKFDTIPEIALENRYFTTPEVVKVFARIAYSERALHVWLRTVETSHRAEEFGPVGEPYHDSCLEFFFSPDKDFPERYFNFEFNSNKCIYLGFRNSEENKIRILVDPNEKFSPEIKFNQDGWEISYSIPYEFIRIFVPGFEPKSGMQIRANCFKCADRQIPEEYLSWNYVTLENFKFHKPECFGLMTFE